METYEEKYNRALENFKKIKVANSDNKKLVNFIECEYPELKESEDEKSKKWILEYLYDGLRKSDEQFKGQFKAAIAWLEKQGEQNPAWSEDDKRCWSIIIAEFSKCAGKSVSKDEWMCCNDWLNSLRNRVQPQPKQEWSEEDVKFIDTLSNCINELKEKCGWNYMYVGEKDIPMSDITNWLKSIKPNHWKPSELQLEALESAYKQLPNIQHFLQSLYNDLKNL